MALRVYDVWPLHEHNEKFTRAYHHHMLTEIFSTVFFLLQRYDRPLFSPTILVSIFQTFDKENVAANGRKNKSP